MDFWKRLCGDADNRVLPYILAIVGNVFGIGIFVSFTVMLPYWPVSIVCIVAVAVCLVNIFRIGFGLFKHIRKD